jgi:hypothetical protein
VGKAKLKNMHRKHLRRWLRRQIRRAYKLESRMSIPEMEALLAGKRKTSKAVLCLLNNICEDVDSYLEVGLYEGATLCAAVLRNDIRATGIEDFSWREAKLGKDTLLKNVERHRRTSTSVNLIFKSFRDVDPAEIGDVDVYFYDADHTRVSQYYGLIHFRKTFSKRVILIVDDYDNTNAQLGTEKALRRLNGELKYITLYDEYLTCPPPQRGHHHWWNGVRVVCLER